MCVCVCVCVCVSIIILHTLALAPALALALSPPPAFLCRCFHPREHLHDVEASALASTREIKGCWASRLVDNPRRASRHNYRNGVRPIPVAAHRDSDICTWCAEAPRLKRTQPVVSSACRVWQKSRGVAAAGRRQCFPQRARPSPQ